MIFNKTLNSMRKGDFNKFNTKNTYQYFDMEVSIEWDYLNGRWYYGSETHEVNGVFYGSVVDLKKQIKYEYNNLNK